VTNRGAVLFHRYSTSLKKTVLWYQLADPEPHSFDVRLTLGHRGHVHDYDVAFREHDHDHDHSALEGLDVTFSGISGCARKGTRERYQKAFC
jgi:nickel/cobalt exporter